MDKYDNIMLIRRSQRIHTVYAISIKLNKQARLTFGLEVRTWLSLQGDSDW